MSQIFTFYCINTLNTELNPICHLLALSVSRSFLYDALKGCVLALTVLVIGYSPLLYTDRYYSLLVNPYLLSQLLPLGLSFGDCLVV